MKVTLQVHKPIIFTGKKGDNFIRENIRHPKYTEKTSVLVDKIKNEFGIKTDKADDILEALIDRVKDLNIKHLESDKRIEDLEAANQRLSSINYSNSSVLESREEQIRHLKYLLKRK